MKRYWTLTAEEKRTLDGLVLDYLRTAYRNLHGPEPTITAAEVADYLMQHGSCPEPVRGVKRWTFDAAYESLGRLTRSGLIERSTAWVNGREARCYNPSDLSLARPVTEREKAWS